jgi:hypothetical protein
MRALIRQSPANRRDADAAGAIEAVLRALNLHPTDEYL